MPSSGSVHPVFEERDEDTLQIPHRLAQDATDLARHVERRHDLPVDVELELAGGRVPDPHRGRLFVAGKPRDFPLLEAPFPPGPYMICRSAGSPATARSSQLRQAMASSK